MSINEQRQKRIHKYKRMLKKIGWYFPYWGAGIGVSAFNENLTRIEVSMRLRWFNKNLFGTHFGGSLYSMCDPFFVLITVCYLGNSEYIVWDKSAKIDFKKPGKGTVKAIFELQEATLDAIKTEVDDLGKKTYIFTAEVRDEENEVVAVVEKEIYVRKNKKH